MHAATAFRRNALENILKIEGTIHLYHLVIASVEPMPDDESAGIHNASVHPDGRHISKFGACKDNELLFQGMVCDEEGRCCKEAVHYATVRILRSVSSFRVVAS